MLNLTNNQESAIFKKKKVPVPPNKLAKIKKLKKTRVVVDMREADTLIVSLTGESI